MTTWSFKREEAQFEQITAGDHRAIITDVQRKVSRSGNDMLELTFSVSGYKSTIRSWIVFLEDKPEITNRTLTNLMDSFSIAENDMVNGNIENWIGHAGGIHTEMRESDNGNEYASVRYFLTGNKLENLPAWQGDAPKVASGFASAAPEEEDDLPFDFS